MTVPSRREVALAFILTSLAFLASRPASSLDFDGNYSLRDKVPPRRARVMPVQVIPTIGSDPYTSAIFWDPIGMLQRFIDAVMRAVDYIINGSGGREDFRSDFLEDPGSYKHFGRSGINPEDLVMDGMDKYQQEAIRRTLTSFGSSYLFISDELAESLHKQLLSGSSKGGVDLGDGELIQARSFPLPLFLNPNDGSEPIQLGLIFPEYPQLQDGIPLAEEKDQEPTKDPILKKHEEAKPDSLKELLQKESFILAEPQKPVYQYQYNLGGLDKDEGHVSELMTNDGTVHGSYSFVQPDGLRRVVSYVAGKDGFLPRVKYEKVKP